MNKLKTNSYLENAWVAVRVQGRSEKRVADRLLEEGYECFLPLIPAKTAPSKNQATKPLFPGYLFCRYKTQCKTRIVQVLSVLDIVSFCKTPAIVSEEEIASIFKIVHSGFYPEPNEFIMEGQRVRIISGPLMGVEGFVVDANHPNKVVVTVNALNRALAVTVTDTILIPI